MIGNLYGILNSIVLVIAFLVITALSTEAYTLLLVLQAISLVVLPLWALATFGYCISTKCKN